LVTKVLNLKVIICSAQKGRSEKTNAREGLTFWRSGGGSGTSQHITNRQVKDTRPLQIIEGETGQNGERKQEGKGHSRTGR